MARISQSEPFSDKFPVTGKNAGKFKLFPPEMVAIEFANKPFPEPSSSPSGMLGWKIEQGI